MIGEYNQIMDTNKKRLMAVLKDRHRYRKVVRGMSPQMKRSVFELIENATTEKLPELKVRELTDKVIDLFAEYDLEYSQAFRVLGCIEFTLEARKQFLNP